MDAILVFATQATLSLVSFGLIVLGPGLRRST